jgi:hypothetical protein
MHGLINWQLASFLNHKQPYNSYAFQLALSEVEGLLIAYCFLFCLLLIVYCLLPIGWCCPKNYATGALHK